MSGNTPLTTPGSSLFQFRFTFALRWVRDTVRGGWFCRHGVHSWTYDDPAVAPYCEVCGMPGSWDES